MEVRMPGGNGHLSEDLRLDQIVYLGSHNCAMSNHYGWAYAQQNVSITDQYEKYGARHFKVPIHWYKEKNIPEIVVAHEGDGRSNCKLTYVQRKLKAPEKASVRLKEIIDLAFKYPNEVMILKLESKLLCNSKNNGTEGWDPMLVATMLYSLLCELRADQRAIYFEGNVPPTLGWCRQEQKNLLITIEPREQIIGDLKKFTLYSYTVSAQVDWELDPLKEVQDGKTCRGVRNNSDGSIWSPFLEIHLNPENSFKPDKEYKHKYNFYQHVRKRFLSYEKHCRKMPNFIVADFIDQGTLSNLVDDVNQIINQNGRFLPEVFDAL